MYVENTSVVLLFYYTNHRNYHVIISVLLFYARYCQTTFHIFFFILYTLLMSYYTYTWKIQKRFFFWVYFTKHTAKYTGSSVALLWHVNSCKLKNPFLNPSLSLNPSQMKLYFFNIFKLSLVWCGCCCWYWIERKERSM